MIAWLWTAAAVLAATVATVVVTLARLHLAVNHAREDAGE